VDINCDNKIEIVRFFYAPEDGPWVTMWIKIYDSRLRMIFCHEISDGTPCLLADIDSDYPGKEILISSGNDWSSEDYKGYCIILVFGWNTKAKEYEKIYSYQTHSRYPVLKVTTDKNGWTNMDSYTELKQFDEFANWWTARFIAKQSALSVYKNQRFGFEIAYPKDWPIEYSQNGDGMSYYLQKTFLLRAYAGFDIFKRGAKGELDNIKDSEWKLSSSTNIKVNRISGQKGTYQIVGIMNKYLSGDKIIIVLVVSEKGINYVVFLQSGLKDFQNTYQKIFQKMLNSYKITNGIENRN